MRLIDADALVKALQDDIEGLEEEFPNDKQVKAYKCGVEMALAYIETEPTIDAVPLDQCKECKNLLLPFKGCSANPCVDRRRKYDICSDGERKGDE